MRLQGIAVDFSRHGVGIVIDQPLPKDALVYLTITGKSQHIDNIVGIVHNCTSQAQGYRCGIQFRTTSALQDDQDFVESGLDLLEAEFKETSTG